MQQELQIAVEAAQRAGKIILRKFGELSKSAIHPKEYKDFVTDIDHESESAIMDIISRAFPRDGFLCEESGDREGASGRRWIIDPLDGTLNFIHSFPVFSVSIALEGADGELAAAVIYQPLQEELFTATRGEGAKLNGASISVSDRHDPQHLLIATGIPFKEYHYLDEYVAMLKDVARDSAGIRRAGSAAIDLAYTACGRFDGFFEYKIFPWDYAAGVLLVREAGGRVTGFDGAHDVFRHHSIIAGNPVTHPMLREKAKKHFTQNLLS